jgi:iron complex transport system substrate-binding protein
MRGKIVELPEDPKRVATIDDGFVEAVMTHLGVADKVAAIASWSLKREYRYDYGTISGETYEYAGLNTMKYLHPWLDRLPCFNSPQGDILNFEALAKAEPDLVILRVGDCTVGDSETEKAQGTIETIEALGIPILVIYAPSFFHTAGLSTMGDEMRVIGEAFGKRDEAVALWDYLASIEAMAKDRVKGIPDGSKARVAYLGLNPDLRKRGAMAAVFGTNTPESYVIESLANAKNAFRGKGHAVPLNLEKLYVLDPDVIILPTYNGYHPPRELYEAPYFEDLSYLKAIRDRRVFSLPWTPMNCARRLEYPIDILITAKAAYPEAFRDFLLKDFVLGFYQRLYGVDMATAEGLKGTQLLGWTDEYGF